MGFRLPRSFYERSAEVVAPELLGKVLHHRLDAERRESLLAGATSRDHGNVILSGRIVEVEAYKGQLDPGSHAFRGETSRNRVMFGPAGYVYVYISYGQHRCMNVVTESPGIAGAVLIRALEPVAGIPIMEALRGGKPIVDLANGPGKLCQALGITLTDNGDDLEGSEIWIEDDGFRPAEVAASTRVGLTAGVDMELRFYIPGNPYVSKGRPSGPPPRRIPSDPSGSR